ncbi:hypothetical protein Tco_0954767 [Tanacetum coccineum]|uniref:Integrase, catalytic region, zinc finger, CCHC-type, peptidase aspartic, catalytic n=1 Tax=Tanacetum coccineum TaxID=301880 RepID=A0ABQ5E5A1_9ASTR
MAPNVEVNLRRLLVHIILQGLPTEIYSLVNHQRVAKDLWEKVQLLMQGRLGCRVPQKAPNVEVNLRELLGLGKSDLRMMSIEFSLLPLKLSPSSPSRK